jgi:hypothetical protein
MPDIKLGPAGQELILPKPRYRSGPSWPIAVERSIEEAEMSDGSFRYNFKSEERQVWSFEWDLLRRTQLEDFEWLRRFKTSLQFQNTWDNETWYTVVMTAYEREPLVDVHTDEVLFRVRLTLKEVR